MSTSLTPSSAYINHHHLQCAIRTACAMVLATYLALLLHFDAPYWAVISVVTIMNPYVGSTLQKGFFRIIGTIIGAFLGVVVANFDISNSISFLLIIFITIFIMNCFVSITRYPYAFLLTGVTFLFVFGSLALGPNQPSITAGWRSVEITLGVISASVITLVIFPKDAIKDMWQHLRHALTCCQDWLQQISQRHCHEQTVMNLADHIDKMHKHFAIFAQELGSSHYQYNTVNTIADELAALQQHWSANYVTYAQLTQLDWIDDIHLPISSAFAALAKYFHQLSQMSSRNNHAIDEIQRQITHLFDTYEKLRQQNILFNYPHRETRTVNLALQSIRTIWQHAQAIQQAMTNLTLHSSESDEAKSIFTGKLNDNTIKQSIKMALSVTLAMAIWLQSNWPGGLQGLISAFIVGMPKYIVDIKRTALLRLLGAMLGASVGLFTLGILHYSLIELLMVIFIMGAVFSYVTFNSTRYGYIGLQANIALALCLVQAGGPPTTIAPALMRLSGIVLGIGSTFLINYFIWPQRPLAIYQKMIHSIASQLPKTMTALLISKQTKSDTTKQIQALDNMITECQQVYTAIKSEHKINKASEANYQNQLTCLSQLIQLITTFDVEIDMRVAHDIANTHQLHIAPQIDYALQCVNQYSEALIDHNLSKPTIDFVAFQQRNHAIGDKWRQLHQQAKVNQQTIAQLFGLLHYLELFLMALTSETATQLEQHQTSLYNQAHCPGGTAG